jgi:hypothetical protein
MIEFMDRFILTWFQLTIDATRLTSHPLRCSLQPIDILPGGQMYLPPRARQAAQTLAADQVHQCVPVCLRCCAALSLCAFAGGIAVAAPEKCPCFQFARLLRSRPSGVRGPVTLAAVKLAPAVRHGCRSAGLACPLGSSTAAASSVRPNQCLKARPHALNRFALARKRFIAHFCPFPRRRSRRSPH